MRKFYEADAKDSAGGSTERVVTATEPVDVEQELKKMKGAFVTSLQRRNKDILNDRALAIAQRAQRSYRRKIEDVMDEIRELKITRVGNLDLSPGDKNSLTLANNFDPDDFVGKDLQSGKQIENLEITLRILEERYAYLFGENVTR